MEILKLRNTILEIYKSLDGLDKMQMTEGKVRRPGDR